MTENEWEDNLEKEIVKEVEKCWHEVFKASKKIIADADVFGFYLIEENGTPNIHKILDSLKIIEFEINFIWNKHVEGELDINDTRLIHNTKQQILNMQKMANALKRKDKNLYNEALRCLLNQASM